MGCRLVNVASELGFFSLGLTSAYFQVSGKLPVCRERLIILLKTGRRTSRHSTTSGVGIRSKLQDFLLDFPIRRLISSSIKSVNELSWVEHKDGFSTAGLEWAFVVRVFVQRTCQCHWLKFCCCDIPGKSSQLRWSAGYAGRLCSFV